ncbi:MAG: dTDP-4-dehydrorhamnose 3,5-epimerase [Simkaniaceae bacterium]|nr:dTDP-4-dehydrorhamnose 3,5-epimerase [Simkaniaceae bacterium]
MNIKELSLPGLKLIIPSVHPDDRGFFLESYRESLYKQMGIPDLFVQDNHSFSKMGVIRGMHFDIHQAKLVRVISGKIFDVVVDLRKDQKTFGKWEGVYLDGLRQHQLFVPAGFAHGFFAMSDAHVVYKVSHEYNPTCEKGFRYNDPAIGIKWPIEKPILSKRDENAPLLSELNIQ